MDSNNDRRQTGQHRKPNRKERRAQTAAEKKDLAARTEAVIANLEAEGRRRRDAFKDKKNVYLCDACGHGFVSQDLDGGTTPFATPCLQQDCTGMATSLMYKIPQEVLTRHEPAVGFRVPPETEVLTDGERKHVENGGLLSYVRDELGRFTRRKNR